MAGFEFTKYICPNLQNQGIPLFKGKNIQNSHIIYNFENFIPIEVSNQLKRSQITKKCLLTPYVGTIGNIAIHNRTGIYHLGSNVGKIELYNNYEQKILEEYVLSYMKSFTGYLQLTKFKKATAQESISIDAIREVYIPIAPLKMQKFLQEKIRLIFALIN